MQRCAEGFYLDNMFSQSVCISLEYTIKGVSTFLDYQLLLRFYTGKLYVWRGVRRGVQSCAEGCWRCAEGCTKGYAEVCRGVRRGAWRCAEVCGGVRGGNLKFKVYFELLHLLWMVDSLRTSKVYHCMSLVTIGCP